MTLPVVWLAEAATELQDAVRWYTDINPQLGLRFANAVENTVEAIAETPLLSPSWARAADEPEYAAFHTACIFFQKKRVLSSLPASTGNAILADGGSAVLSIVIGRSRHPLRARHP